MAPMQTTAAAEQTAPALCAAWVAAHFRGADEAVQEYVIE
jgi:hypothetical protein